MEGWNNRLSQTERQSAFTASIVDEEVSHVELVQRCLPTPSGLTLSMVYGPFGPAAVRPPLFRRPNADHSGSYILHFLYLFY